MVTYEFGAGNKIIIQKYNNAPSNNNAPANNNDKYYIIIIFN